jgi:DNA-damage-inducible protein J
MAAKTANVVARVEPEIKEQAENIMEKLGLSASTAINMFYRQVIYWNGMPFRPSIPVNAPKAYDEMSKEEFDAAMSAGLAQAMADQSDPVDEVFDRLIGEIANG